MNKILTLASAILLLASCNSNKTTSNDSVVTDSVVCLNSDYRVQRSIADVYYCDLDDDCDDDFLDVSEISVNDLSNYYYVNNNGAGSITVHDLDGNYYYIDVDGYGNLSAHDLNGNYYYSYTDDFGNTSGYDCEGNFYHSYTDDYGNTSGYDSNGNYFHSYTDDFGNTTGYDSDGNFYSAYSDDFGNTTINVY